MARPTTVDTPPWSRASSSGSAWQRMLTDTVTVGAGTSISKIAGAVKVAVMARYFGAGDAVDAFLIAFLLPSFLADVIAGCWTPSIVPVLLRTPAGNRSPARLARTALTLGCGFMACTAVLLAIAGPFALPLVGSSFTPEKLRLTKGLFYTLLTGLPISGCVATWRALLNSRGTFAIPAIAPAATPILTIAALWWLSPSIGVYALVAGTLAGVVAEAAVLAVAVRRSGFSIAPAWDGWTPEAAAIWKQYLPLTAGAMISSACIIVDQAIAGMLGAGSVSALAYGGKFVAVGLAITATAAGTAVLPVFSRLAATGEWRELRRSAAGYIGGAFALSVPATALLIYYSEPIVRVLFERGAFGADATSVVATVQRYALTQVPFALALALVVRLAAALEATSLLARVAIAGFIANLVGDIVLARWMGIAGIALATAVVQAVSVAALVYLLVQREPRLLATRESHCAE